MAINDDIEAPAETLPTVLREPPWQQVRKKKTKPVVADGLVALERAPRMNWRSGQQLAFTQHEYWNEIEKFLHGSSDDIERLLAQEPPSEYWCLAESLPKLVARHELATLPILDALRVSHLPQVVRILDPIDATAAAPLAAEAFYRLKSIGRWGRSWLLRYPETAAVALVPVAAGAKGKAREAARKALRVLVLNGQRAMVAKVAARYGDNAVAALRDDVIDLDPLDVFPKKLPQLPPFWDAASLPRPELRGDGGVLGDTAVLSDTAVLGDTAMDALGTMLAFSSIDDPYPGIAEVRAACTPESLSRFAWALFEAWLAAGAASKQKWAFYTLGAFGDDVAARRLEPLLRKWPKESAHARAVMGLEILATIGTDFALMQIHGIALKARNKGIQKAAREAIDQLADERGLSADELADRLVPDLGLGVEGALVLDYGRRVFKIGFDEMLTPFVVREDGKKVKTPPKPGKTDDDARAPAAFERYKELKKQLKAVARQQITRLELAMCAQRRWSARDFETLVLGHPLMIHLVKRLVWGVWKTTGSSVRTFRIDEEYQRVDWDDDPVPIDGESSDLQVGVVHPLDLPDHGRKRWAEQLADYEIVPPFEQLSRQVYRPSEEDRHAMTLERYEGVQVASGRIRGMENIGWRRGESLDGGMVWTMARPLDDEHEVRLGFEPGLFAGGTAYEDGEQNLVKLWIARARDDGYSSTARLAFGKIPLVLFSEIVRDVERLKRSAA